MQPASTALGPNPDGKEYHVERNGFVILVKRPNVDNMPKTYVNSPQSEITTIKSKGRTLVPPKAVPRATNASQMTQSMIGDGDYDESNFARKEMKKLTD